MKEEVNIFWFRRDLRTEDNIGLAKASMGKSKVLPIFIFDPEILNELPKDDARVTFIHDCLQSLSETLTEEGIDVAIYYDTPLDAFTRITNAYAVQNVITNRDYEPYALKRDKEIAAFLETQGVGFHTFKDQVIFEQNEVVKADGDPYTVYTPFMRKWKARLKEHPIPNQSLPVNFDNFLKNTSLPKVTLEQMGFMRSTISVKPFSFTEELITDYEARRNFPAVNGTTNLSPHLRFGTVSVRELVRRLLALDDEKLLNELIWREFFMQILWHFPHTVHKAFKPKYDRVPWRKSPEDLEAWKTGQTGYPIVDAGMRELNETGYMHNRVRMIVASFLCKHLLLDWREGEAYFAEKLLDYEQSSNVGNWQWAAGSGVDAAPYFRIFNPMTQRVKFDKQDIYIKKWVPELDSPSYPEPIVEHKQARERCLTAYKSVLT